MGKLVDKFVPVIGAVGPWWFFGHEWTAMGFIVAAVGWGFAPQVWAWFKDLAK